MPPCAHARTLPPRLLRLFPLLAVALVSACGGSEPTAKSPKLKDATPTAERDDLHGVRTSSEIGGMNEDEVDAVFKKTLSTLERCLNKGAARVEFLSGSVSFFLKVDSAGKVDQAYLERSTLGDRDTEKCMLAALKSRTWPKPVGGEHGLAKKSFDFDSPNDVRPPMEWDSERAKTVLKKLGDKLNDCRGGASGSFEATAYVSTEGSVITASVTPPNESGEAAVDCLVDTLREASFPSPGSWPAKITFSL
ncbi:MAG TPA: AgmX/PglI C-terminal domain-containing protein [Polyangiaceae bacterium]|nr:AgmX/PglI C-terminal domain-containing protein [Polyangiaceae bacterium]